LKRTPGVVGIERCLAAFNTMRELVEHKAEMNSPHSEQEEDSCQQ